MNFLEVDLIDAPDATKDEIRIGLLHGIDISKEAAQFLSDPDHIREIRLLKQLGYAKHLKAPTNLLKQIRAYLNLGRNPDEILDVYYNKVSNAKLIKIMQTAIKYPINDNLISVPEDSLDAILYGITKQIDISEIITTIKTLRPEIVNLLVNLKISNIDIKPFVDGLWDRDRIIALLQGSVIIDPADLIREFNIGINFTAGEITEIIKAYELNYNLAVALSDTDPETDVPDYNQYQMYEITDGYKLLKAEVKSYLNPELTDLEMRQIKEKLIKERSKHNSSFRAKILKINRNLKLPN